MMKMGACRICKNMSFAWDVLQILQLPDMQESVSPATFFSFLDPNWVPIGSRLEPIWSTWRLFEGPWGLPGAILGVFLRK